MKLFSYGTLMRQSRLEALLGVKLEPPQKALLRGYRRIQGPEGMPMIIPDAAGEVEGLLWEIGDADLTFLDHYEGADLKPPLYRREWVQVQVGDETVEALAYVGAWPQETEGEGGDDLGAGSGH